MAEILNTNVKLKKCPFCRKPGFLFRDPLWSNGHGYYGHYEYYVKCDNDECTVKVKTKAQNDIYKPKDEAIKSVIESWNKR